MYAIDIIRDGEQLGCWNEHPYTVATTFERICYAQRVCDPREDTVRLIRNGEILAEYTSSNGVSVAEYYAPAYDVWLR